MKITRYSFPVKSKIAVLADIHDRAFDVGLLEREKVDIILIPGDITSTHLSRKGFETDSGLHEWIEPENAINLFRTLPKIAPTFFSRGNHEIRWNKEDYQFVKETGTVLLDAETVKINGNVISGISSSSRHCDPNNRLSDAEKLMLDRMEKEEGTKILLLHEPQLYYRYGIDKRNIGLVVSGHAHGGQWRFFNRGVFAPGQGIFPKYTKGIYDDRLVVSAGMSNTVAPIPRLFNPTEIVILEPISGK